MRDYHQHATGVGEDAQAVSYIEAEASGGRVLFDRVWEGPEWIPDAEEIRAPDRWIARAGLAASTAGG